MAKSTALTKLQTKFSDFRKASAARVARYKGSKPAKVGVAAGVGLVSGVAHSQVALDVWGRSVPLALPLGLVAGLMGDGMVAEAGVAATAAGTALMGADEARRMGWAKR